MKRLLVPALILATTLISLAAPEIGKPAPDFSLKDSEGKTHTLSDLKGKTVVLEWVNYGCPFVKKHYESKNMQKLQKAAADDGVVWLSVCSSAPGKQGNKKPGEAAAKSKAYDWSGEAYLLDEDGAVGQLYGAKTTPEIFVINPEGTLVYMGAIDDQPSSKQASIEGATNFVQVALDAVKSSQAVEPSSTKPYGCSVKY